MTEEVIIQILRESFYTVLTVSAPMLGVALLVGFGVGIFQAVTSINEMTLTFIPKIVLVVVVLLLFMPWMLRTMLAFTTNLFNDIPNLIWIVK